MMECIADVRDVCKSMHGFIMCLVRQCGNWLVETGNEVLDRVTAF